MAIITRSDWGAGPHRASTIHTPVSRLFLHHTVTPEWTGADAARKLQDIAFGRGFLDISYSWLVDVDGNEIEGRGWGRQGAHTVGYNSTSHAISLVGNFEVDQPPAKMLAAAARLVGKHASFGPGRITNGHRDVSQTSCPGKYAYAAIDEINRLAVEGDDIADPASEDGEIMQRSNTSVRGDGSAAAVQEVCNDWLDAYNAFKRAVGQSESGMVKLDVDDIPGTKTVNRVQYVCSRARPATIPDPADNSGFHMAHVALVGFEAARLRQAANSVKDAESDLVAAALVAEVRAMVDALDDDSDQPA